MCLKRVTCSNAQVDSDQGWDEDEWNVKGDKGGSLGRGDGQVRGAQWGSRWES